MVPTALACWERPPLCFDSIDVFQNPTEPKSFFFARQNNRFTDIPRSNKKPNSLEAGGSFSNRGFEKYNRFEKAKSSEHGNELGLVGARRDGLRNGERTWKVWAQAVS